MLKLFSNLKVCLFGELSIVVVVARFLDVSDSFCSQLPRVPPQTSVEAAPSSMTMRTSVLKVREIIKQPNFVKKRIV